MLRARLPPMAPRPMRPRDMCSTSSYIVYFKFVPISNTYVTFFAPWINIFADIVDCTDTIFYALVTNILVIIYYEAYVECAANISFVYFVWGETVGQDDIIEYTRKETFNPRFRFFADDILTPGDDIHF